MKSTDAPSKQAVPFGTNGPREAITDTTPSGSNQASYDQGFPPITMTLKSAGGLPPKGQDMNQILFEQSSFNRYFAAGGGYVYDSTFSTSVGGYPLSARIPNSTGTGFWFNTVEDNQTNPENSTASLTGWIPMGSYGVTALTGLTSASVTLTTLQASKERITLAGTLTANINIVVPAWRKSWTVVNNCTGAFSVTIKTPSGTGVAIPAGNTAYVLGDGTNITQDVNVLGNTGKLLGSPKIFTSSGTYTPTTGTSFVIVECLGGGGGGGGCAANGASQASGGQGGGAGAYGVGYFTTGFSGVTMSIGTAGTAGASGVNDGGAGGTTSFGSLLSVSGGVGGKSGQTLVLVALGQTATNNTATITGANLYSAPGDDGWSAVLAKTVAPANISGKGASSKYGKGASSISLQGDGLAASGRGAGGSGGISYASAAAQAGGAGTAGMIVIWEYA